MKEFKAYCKYCSKVSSGKVTNINSLESGNQLYIGKCLICSSEIRRIVPKHKNLAEEIDRYPERLSYMEENGI